jgi:hypothetical protein
MPGLKARRLSKIDRGRWLTLPLAMISLLVAGLLSIGAPVAEAGQPFLTANPNPLVITKANGGGWTKLTYDSGDGTRARIGERIDGVDIGIQHSDTDSQGSKDFWIQLGKAYTFRLYAFVQLGPAGSSPKLVGQVVVKGVPGGCIAKCIEGIKVVPFGTFADIFVNTTVATSLVVSVCRKPPAKNGECVENNPIPWAGFSLGALEEHHVRPPIGRLEPDTRYYIGVIAKDASGNKAVATATFRTQFRRVTIHFDRIRVIDDSDATGAGELLFGFFTGKPGDPFYREAFRNADGWKSGLTYIPNRKLTMDGSPTTIPVLVAGRDDDATLGDEAFSTCGTKLKFSWFPESGPSGGCSAAWMEWGWNHFTVDLSPKENAETFIQPFLYVTISGDVDFSVKGRAIVTYIKR